MVPIAHHIRAEPTLLELIGDPDEPVCPDATTIPKSESVTVTRIAYDRRTSQSQLPEGPTDSATHHRGSEARQNEFAGADGAQHLECPTAGRRVNRIINRGRRSHEAARG